MATEAVAEGRSCGNDVLRGAGGSLELRHILGLVFVCYIAEGYPSARPSCFIIALMSADPLGHVTGLMYYR